MKISLVFGFDVPKRAVYAAIAKQDYDLGHHFLVLRTPYYEVEDVDLDHLVATTSLKKDTSPLKEFVEDEDIKFCQVGDFTAIQFENVGKAETVNDLIPVKITDGLTFSDLYVELCSIMRVYGYFDGQTTKK